MNDKLLIIDLETNKKTEQYNNLKSEQKEHDLKIRYMTLTGIENELENLQQQLTRRKDIREKCNQKVLLLEEKLTSLEKEREEILEELHEKDVVLDP